MTGISHAFLGLGKALSILPIGLLLASCGTEETMPAPWYPEMNAQGDSVLAVYESRVPCPDCQRLKLALVVYGDGTSHLPSTYLMGRVYVGKNDDRLTNSGIIEVVQGTALDPSHTVYRLGSGAPAEFQSFWKLNEDLLFVLDDKLSPKVGDAGHGYVLNKTR